MKIVLRTHATFRSIHKKTHWIQWLGTDPNIISHYDVHRNLPGNKTSLWIYESALVRVTGVTDCPDLSHVFRLVKCDHLCIRYKYKRFYTNNGPSDKIQRTSEHWIALRLFFQVEETADMWRIQWQIYVFLSLCAAVAFLRCRGIVGNGFALEIMRSRTKWDIVLSPWREIVIKHKINWNWQCHMTIIYCSVLTNMHFSHDDYANNNR